MQENSRTKACPRCAHENDADTLYCGNCGLPLDGLCPNCGTQNEHSTHYCVSCGHDFATAAPAPQNRSAVGDLRSVQAPLQQSGPLPSLGETRGIECPRCHRMNEPGAVFCFNCGLPFDSASGVSGNFVGPHQTFSVANAFSFNGRIKPGTYFAYWALALGLAVAGWLVAYGSVNASDSAGAVGGIFALVVYAGSFWVELAAVVRRFRDAALSLWWLLLILVPFGGLVLFIMALVSPSKPARPRN